MDLELQVISLDLAMRLRELGLKNKSIFLWEYYNEKCYAVKFIPYAVVPNDFNNFQLYSAFTASELCEIIPYQIYDQILIINKCWNCWEIKYQEGDYPTEKSLCRIVEDNLSDCLAKTLIYLIENNHVKSEDL